MERQAIGVIRRVWQRLFGKPFTEEEHTEEADDIIERVGREWDRKVRTTGAKFVVATQAFADKFGLEGLYLPYVFFVLERPRRWPTLPSKHKRALEYASRMMTNEHDTPPYRGIVTLPAGDDEKLVDRILTEIAKWCDGPLRKIAQEEFKKVLSGYVAQVEKSEPTLRGSKAYIYLTTLMEHDLATHPEFFRDSNLLWEAYEFLDL